MLFAPVRRQLAFPHGAGQIVGDLHLPPAATPTAPVPAVIMVHGSGPAAGEFARNWEDIGSRLAAVGIALFADALALYRRVLGRVRAGHPAAAILVDEITCSVPTPPNWPRSPASGSWSSSPVSPTTTRCRRLRT